ncbi:MAG: hypothetical protein KAY24_02345, partial [Candidatus Eisenbacteria sp.]|nr:hypothetical protein [Candidatus Eisenbacteria bacterium]
MSRGTKIIRTAVLWAALIYGPAAFTATNATELTYDFSFAEPLWNRSQLGEDFEIPQLEGARTIGHPGEPLLPVYSARILLPPGEEIVTVRVVPESTPLVAHHLPAPAQSEHPLSMEGPFPPTEPKEEIYASASLFPAEPGEFITVQRYRGHSIAYVNLFPLRARLAIGAVEFTANLRLEISTAPSEQALANSARMYRTDASTRSWLRRNVENPELADSYEAAYLSGQIQRAPTQPRGLVDPAETRVYVIITSETLAPVYQALADDRTSKGLPAEIVTVPAIYAAYTGRDPQEQVRNFIIDAYQNWNSEYILFGGDIDVIPDRDCYCYIIDEGNPMETNDLCCELYYGGLDGTWNDDDDDRWGEVGEEDLIPDIHVGRVCSDNSTQAQNFINKLIRYEREPVVDEAETASFYGEYLWELTWGEMYMEEIRLGASTWGYTTAGVPLYWDTDTFYEMSGSWSGSDYINEMNGGCHMAHHLGHSNSSYNCKVSIGDIPSFTADGIGHTYNIGYSQGCMAGEFDHTDCIHEEFV